jgi:hypothetical protein
MTITVIRSDTVITGNGPDLVTRHRRHTRRRSRSLSRSSAPGSGSIVRADRIVNATQKGRDSRSDLYFTFLDSAAYETEPHHDGDVRSSA